MNLDAFNTEYDDYNSAMIFLGSLSPFCYSTNRHTQGGEFNIRYEPMNVTWDRVKGELTVYNGYSRRATYTEEFGVLLNAVKRVNSTGNELGPCLLHSRDPGFADANLVLLYASDLDGDFDIGFTFNTENPAFAEVESVAFLNSRFNDLYPSFNIDYSRIYFCSDREEGIYNIFSVEVDYAGDSIIRVLTDVDPHEVVLNEVLSSEYEDKCPYLFQNLLVFASDRPGGYGGFDLYYSKMEMGEWGAPVNFGPAINTGADEYRPILFEEEVDEDRYMMIFSSDRTGGKGGFDLYYMGILSD